MTLTGTFGGPLTANGTRESSLVNSSASTGGPRSNVLALKHTHANGSAAIRFLRQSDGKEVGAVGYQNGSGGFFLDGAAFLSATAPYDPDTGALTGTPAPSRLILGQEGYYLGAQKFAARLLFDTDWSMRINDPNGNAILSASPTGAFVFPIKTKAGAPSDSDVTNPQDGMLLLDTTNHRLYVRDGGAWKYASLT